MHEYPEILIGREVVELFGFTKHEIPGIATLLNISKVVGNYMFTEKILIKLVHREI